MLVAMKRILILIGLAVLVALPASAQLTVSRTNVISSVTLAWDPSPDSTVSTYNLYYGASSLTYTNVISIPVGVTNYTLVGLPRGVTLFYNLTAYSASLSLESLYSGEINYALPALPRPPNLKAATGK